MASERYSRLLFSGDDVNGHRIPYFLYHFLNVAVDSRSFLYFSFSLFPFS